MYIVYGAGTRESAGSHGVPEQHDEKGKKRNCRQKQNRPAQDKYFNSHFALLKDRVRHTRRADATAKK
jgi:hypothetical protein